MPCWPSSRSSVSRVPEPVSRTTSGVAASVAHRQRAAPAGPRVIGRDDDDELVGGDVQRVQVGELLRALDEADVGTAVAHLALDECRVGDPQLGADVGWPRWNVESQRGRRCSAIV